MVLKIYNGAIGQLSRGDIHIRDKRREQGGGRANGLIPQEGQREEKKREEKSKKEKPSPGGFNFFASFSNGKSQCHRLLFCQPAERSRLSLQTGEELAADTQAAGKESRYSEYLFELSKARAAVSACTEGRRIWQVDSRGESRLSQMKQAIQTMQRWA